MRRPQWVSVKRDAVKEFEIACAISCEPVSLFNRNVRFLNCPSHWCAHCHHSRIFGTSCRSLSSSSSSSSSSKKPTLLEGISFSDQPLPLVTFLNALHFSFPGISLSLSLSLYKTELSKIFLFQLSLYYIEFSFVKKKKK